MLYLAVEQKRMKDKVVKYKPLLFAAYFKKETEISLPVETTLLASSGPN